MKVVASGIDTLVMGFSIQAYLDVNDFEALTEAKIKAGEKQFDSKGCGIDWFGVEFSMKPRGAMVFQPRVNDRV